MSTAYTTEKTWATGDDATAALFNTHIRDNSQFLHQPPCCRVFNSANIPHGTSGTDVFLTFNSERFDTDTMHSTSSLTGRIVATTAGKYMAGAHVEWASNATGLRGIYLRVNGTTKVSEELQTAINGASHRMSTTTLYTLAASDYFEVGTFQSSGGALNVNVVGNVSPEFWASWQAA